MTSTHHVLYAVPMCADQTAPATGAFQIGDTVEVSTDYRLTGVLRDRAGQWIPPQTWRRAVVASEGIPGNFGVQFNDGGAHWHFAAEEMRSVQHG